MSADKVKVDQRLRAVAPFVIPKEATFSATQKAGGYRQFKYCWQDKGWSYEARYHEAIPGATLVKWPSWRLDRTKAGKGYGPTAHARIEQSLVAGHWLPTSQLRYYARLVQNGQATREQAAFLLAAHYRSQTANNPGKTSFWWAITAIAFK